MGSIISFFFFALTSVLYLADRVHANPVDTAAMGQEDFETCHEQVRILAGLPPRAQIPHTISVIPVSPDDDQIWGECSKVKRPEDDSLSIPSCREAAERCAARLATCRACPNLHVRPLARKVACSYRLSDQCVSMFDEIELQIKRLPLDPDRPATRPHLPPPPPPTFDVPPGGTGSQSVAPLAKRNKFLDFLVKFDIVSKRIVEIGVKQGVEMMMPLVNMLLPKPKDKKGSGKREAGAEDQPQGAKPRARPHHSTGTPRMRLPPA